MTKTNEKELIIQEIFKKTNTKITEDDPLVEVIIGFQQVLEDTKEDFREWAGIFNAQFQDEMTDIALKSNTQLAILDHDVSEIRQNIAEVTNTILASFDEKAKDLNMILTKLQVNHEQDTSDNFAKHLAKIDDKYQQMMAIQAKDKAFSQREVLFGVGGLVAGVIACLLVFLVVR
ncbi:hypothetical protein [Moraxella bovis]|uniref:Uncharacterized protein n=1 Tax=Moraxella bovis TaxID=476 RepID=Q5KT67_MORBO|nr:hypothetical protein [Moraxella bovis]AWY21809.1 hypothetical protein DQF64_14625 [Moraxella bovis]OOR90544.1 hypothetical protein B0182_04940 [Moraxella bovis]BAD83746.1 hypothetical protein [Moraxella bovis Epp63]